MDTNRKGVAIYARVSCQEQATEGVSIDAQIAALRAYAKSQGWQIVDKYVDGGYSGGTDERPALKRLLIDARHRRFDIIAVSKLDRFFRNLRLLLNYLHDLEQQGIKFVATQEGLDTSNPYGKFAVQIMGTIAEFERGRIGERVKDSRQYLIAQGNWPGGRTAYGYRWIFKERRWEVIPGEVAIVKRIYDFYANEKLGIDAIVKKLNKEGLRTREGYQWRCAGVRYILVYPGYKGQHQLGMQMPAIIDEATWQQVQQKLETARSVLRNPKGWLLQGMCFCGLCGHVLSCVHRRPQEPRYYACRGRIHRIPFDGNKYCTLPFIRADEFEWDVWKKVKAVIRNQDTLAECVSKALAELEERKSQVGAEIVSIDDKLETLRAKKERLGIAFADGTVNQNIYKSRLNQIKKQEAAFLKWRHDIDPAEVTELSALESRIAMVKDVLSKGRLSITEFGIFGLTDDEYIPAGFNAWRESDGKLAIGEITEQDKFRIEGTDEFMRGIGVPPGFLEWDDRQEQEKKIKTNLRAILQFFDIKVFVFPDHAEIKGAIPTQVLKISTRGKTKTVPIISSPSPNSEMVQTP